MEHPQGVDDSLQREKCLLNQFCDATCDFRLCLMATCFDFGPVIKIVQNNKNPSTTNTSPSQSYLLTCTSIYIFILYQRKKTSTVVEDKIFVDGTFKSAVCCYCSF